MAKTQVRLERETELKLSKLRNSDPIFKLLNLSQIANILIAESLRARESKTSDKLVAA